MDLFLWYVTQDKLELSGPCSNVCPQGKVPACHGLDIDMAPINLFRYHWGQLLNRIQEEINVDHILLREQFRDKLYHKKDTEVLGGYVRCKLAGHSCATYGFIIKGECIVDIRNREGSALVSPSNNIIDGVLENVGGTIRKCV
jgi:hypothetical protein